MHGVVHLPTSTHTLRYCKIYRRVEPLMARLEAARAAKASADEALAKVEAVVAEVEARLAGLQKNFQKATIEKSKVEAEAANCQERLTLAERLVNGLASENVRWGNEIASLKANEVTLVGDVLLASAFVSYIGGFNAQCVQRCCAGLVGVVVAMLTSYVSLQIPPTTVVRRVGPRHHLSRDPYDRRR